MLYFPETEREEAPGRSSTSHLNFRGPRSPLNPWPTPERIGINCLDYRVEGDAAWTAQSWRGSPPPPLSGDFGCRVWGTMPAVQGTHAKGADRVVGETVANESGGPPISQLTQHGAHRTSATRPPSRRSTPTSLTGTMPKKAQGASI